MRTSRVDANQKEIVTGLRGIGAGWRICIECGEVYHSYNKKRKYCSGQCYNGSMAKRENSIRANNKRRRVPNECKSCGAPTHYTRVYCDTHKPRKRIGVCGNCKKTVPSSYDVDFCKECRATGVHKKEVFSICSKCGEKIPDKPNRKYCDNCWKSQVRLHRGYARKKDMNQNEIVDGLEKAGATVIDASAIGGGFPDLVVGFKNETYLIEVKNPAYKSKLNDLQETFFATWQGQVAIANNLDEAFIIIGAV